MCRISNELWTVYVVCVEGKVFGFVTERLSKRWWHSQHTNGDYITKYSEVIYIPDENILNLLTNAFC